MGPNHPQSGARSFDGREFARYLAVSVVALGVDVSLLYVLAVRLSVDSPVAGAIAYLAGLVVHYVLAVSRVFGFRRLRHSPSAEFAIYAASGILGTLVSYVILMAGEQLGASLWVAKASAVPAAFVVTYLLRRRALFTRAMAGAD